MKLDEALKILEENSYTAEKVDTDEKADTAYWFEELAKICSQEIDNTLYFYDNFIPVAKKEKDTVYMYMPTGVDATVTPSSPALNMEWKWVDISDWDESMFVGQTRLLGNLHKLIKRIAFGIHNDIETIKHMLEFMT